MHYETKGLFLGKPPPLSSYKTFTPVHTFKLHIYTRDRLVYFLFKSTTQLLILSAGLSFFKKKAHGWSLGGFPCCCHNTAPAPVVEASTCTMNGLLGSGWMRSRSPPCYTSLFFYSGRCGPIMDGPSTWSTYLVHLDALSALTDDWWKRYFSETYTSSTHPPHVFGWGYRYSRGPVWWTLWHWGVASELQWWGELDSGIKRQSCLTSPFQVSQRRRLLQYVKLS